MGMLKFSGVLAIVPTVVLLTISFFILVILRKIQEQGLKTFGYVIVVLLWIAASLVFAKGIYTLSKGCHRMKPVMRQMMKEHKRQPMMKQRDMPQPKTRR